jgi:protein-tyrosine phosphatase
MHDSWWYVAFSLLSTEVRVVVSKTDFITEIQTKFHELVWEERGRHLKAMQDGSPSHPFHKVDSPHTKVRDRYANIHPWAGNRIKLVVPQGKNDYINASPVKLTSRKDLTHRAFITMQGPKEGTTSHVWRMVHHELESPAVIIMLTDTHEGGQEKCYPYFPKEPGAAPIKVNEIDEFGDGFKATVTCVEIETSPFPDAIQVRKLSMKVEGQDKEKTVWHLLYTAWPDFGVPQLNALGPIFALMELSKEKSPDPGKTRLIHCSAGVGRTGTYIAMEYLLSELEQGVFEVKHAPSTSADMDDPVFDTVNKLREQRMQMVQADVQYLLIYKVLRQAFEQKYHGAKSAPDATDGEPSSKVARRDSMDDVFS